MGVAGVVIGAGGMGVVIVVIVVIGMGVATVVRVVRVAGVEGPVGGELYWGGKAAGDMLVGAVM
jgi:hypothetical protein